ncbi:hypothetical protein LCGC14_1141130 [marine sediment metagenome]|uniref:Bacteriophage head to tail connecting protein n=1 Tax=marine sediment metagenome TaxID=412755 RepID=A0A0F9LY73_9ZZZZ
MAANVEDLAGYWKWLNTDASQWRTLWQELADYILNRKNDITTKIRPGSKRTAKVYDSTPIRANELLASGMQGSLTSAAVRWFKLAMADEELNELQAVAEWLDDTTDRIYKALNNSNFGAEMQEVYIDLGAFGTAALYLDEMPPIPPDIFGGFRFKTFPIGSYVISEDSRGSVNFVIRELDLPLKVAKELWDTKLSEKLRNKAEKNPFERATFLQAVYARPGINAEEVGLDTLATHKPWASVYFEPETKTLLQEGGFDEFPFMVPRWTKTSGEVYGRGPGMTALPDIRTLNKAVQERFIAWGLALRPPLEVRDRSVVGRVKLTSASINTTRGPDAIKPIDLGTNFDVTNFQEEQIRNSIRAIFFSDQLQFPPKQGTPISATEAAIRFELMQRILGPTLGRLESELLSPLISRAFSVMARAGALLPAPGILTGEDSSMEIRFEGPLSRVQRASELDDINRFYGHTLPLLQADESFAQIFADTVNGEEVLRQIADVTGLRAKLLRTPDQVAARQKARTEAMEQQTEMDSMAENMGKAAPMVKALQGAQEGQPPAGSEAA